jgi:hypothetical protein
MEPDKTEKREIEEQEMEGGNTAWQWCDDPGVSPDWQLVE